MKLSLLFFSSPFGLNLLVFGEVMTSAMAALIFHSGGKPLANAGIISPSAPSCDRRRIVDKHVAGMR
jgi:hypothetical protein